jgi:hypothetical protein
MFSMRAIRLSSVVALLCLAVVPATSATAARHAAARPTITSIGPSSVAVGDTLTIRGRGFVAGSRRNSVSFARAGSPAVTVKAGAATRTRLKVVVPAALARYVGDTKPTRFRVRVRSHGMSPASSALKRSVLVTPPVADPGDGDGTGADDCLADDSSADASDDLASKLADALGIDLSALGQLLVPDDSCDSATAGDDPAGDDSADPADDSADAGDDSSR